MLDLIAYILVRSLNFICHIIPVSLVLALGRRLGIIVYWVTHYRRRIGYSNMKAAFCKSKSPGEIKKMLKSLYERLTETFLEVLCLTKVNDRYIDRYIKIENIENFWKATGEGRGVILLTAHFGNWELSGMVSSIRSFPLYVLARQQKMRRLDGLINRLRQSKGLKVIRKGITTRYIVKSLHEGKMIGMVADQDVGKNGVFANFFGRPASTADGPYRFASRTGAVILPGFMVRIKGPYHKLIAEEPLKIARGEDLSPYIQKYNDILESYARTHYDQWLWLHRRWKSTPLKRIVILSDGKAGHLNQSLSLAESFKRYRNAKGIEDKNTEIEVIDIRFKNRFYKTLINFTSIFSGTACQGCLRCLKIALEKSSYEKLAHTYADVVISTGFSLAGVNSIYRFENNAKNAVCMKPGMLGFKRFDMVVLPRHDVRKTIKRKNVIITDVSPNIINEKYLRKAEEGISKISKQITGKEVLGVLLGGDNVNYRYTEEDISKIISQILDASRRIRADIVFTTSRRTPHNIENLIKETLKDEERCKLLVIANERNSPHTVGGILSLSNVVVVSGESTSMVSEAVSSGKKTIVFKGKKRNTKPTKHEIFLERLSDAGYLKIAEPENLSDVIYDTSMLGDSKVPKKEDWIYRNMWRLGA